MGAYRSLVGARLAWVGAIVALSGACSGVERETAKPVVGDDDDVASDDVSDDTDEPDSDDDEGATGGRDASTRDASTSSDASTRRDAATSSDGGSDAAGRDGSAQNPGDAATASDAGSPPSRDAGTSSDAAVDAGAPPAGEDECGAIPTTLTAEMAGRRSNSYGFTEFDVRSPNQLVRLKTRLQVPVKPPPSGTIFLWPGIQPLDGKNFQPIGNGVLQPVLTWGASCAPGTLVDHSSWWISGQYVNVYGNAGEYRGCKGGKVLRVEPGEVLDIDMVQSGTEWKQIITSSKSGKSVDYTIDLKGQEQGRAIFDIELPTANKPTEDVLFTSTVLTFASPVRACTPVSQGATDYVSRARLSKDGLNCCIDRMALRAKGVAATTMP